jgi:hypothetical protein
MTLSINEHLSLSPYFVDNDKAPNFNWERFQDKIEEVPEVLFGVMVDDVTSEFVKSLTQSYLPLRALGSDIARIIRDVILVDIYIGDMPAQISSRLGIDANTAKEVAKQIVSRVFMPVMEDLKKVQMAKFGKWPVPARQNFAPQNLGGQAGQNQQLPQQTEPQIYGDTVDLRNKS